MTTSPRSIPAKHKERNRGPSSGRLGPDDPLRSATAAELLPAALAAAAQAGVSRLADVTRLDAIGLPVWQAVRPWSRALTVHQGKGATDADAKLGALLEAVESHAAESFGGETVRCTFSEFPISSRAPCMSDFARDRHASPAADAAVEWVRAERLSGPGELFLPLPLVSLDLTVRFPGGFDRASNGVATGATREEALLASLHELVERDSVTEWQALELEERMECVVDPASVGLPWFEEISARVEAAGAVLRCYSVPSVTGTPVFACEINDSTKAAAPFRATNGRGAHPLPEVALFKAMAEAIQSRAAFIAGARDDLYPWRYARQERAVTIAFALPPPPDIERVDFEAIERGPATAGEVLSALERAGYPDAAAVTLAEPPGLCVVRGFVCGLASLTRRRRKVPS